MSFDLQGYVDVAERIRLFKEQHPTGSLRCKDLSFVEFGGKSWVVYVAEAFRSPDDLTPGIGTAWEPVPGATPYTRNSEVQNAETAAWGRAIVASLAGDTRKVASADEVKMRTTATPDWVGRALELDTVEAMRDLYAQAKTNGATQSELDQIHLLAGNLERPAGKDEKPAERNN